MAQRDINEPHNGEMHLRKKALLELAKLFPSSHIHNAGSEINTRGPRFSNGGYATYKRLSRSTVQSYISSQFCLIPSGDTPITRRLFEALGAG